MELTATETGRARSRHDPDRGRQTTNDDKTISETDSPERTHERRRCGRWWIRLPAISRFIHGGRWYGVHQLHACRNIRAKTTAVLADHPAVDIGNLLPGDEGTLSVGLFVEPDSESGRAWMRLDSGAGSQLSEAIEVAVWYDTGIFGIGGCQGAENGPTIDTITPAGATLADPGVLSEGIEINSGVFDNGVIEPGERVCVALSWAFPTGSGNELQDSLTTFDLEFVAVSTDHDGNPFGDGV